MFGNEDNWRGLGVLIDTYDNNMDNKHPYLAVAFNDGTKSWDHDNDGGDMTTYGCKIQPRFRNKGVLQVVVSNLGEHLQVLLYEEDTSKWFDCVNMTIDSSIFRPSISRYFGFTATTGSVTDKHELMSFELYDMQKMGEVRSKSKCWLAINSIGSDDFYLIKFLGWTPPRAREEE